jgi:hypothetical protein
MPEDSLPVLHRRIEARAASIVGRRMNRDLDQQERIEVYLNNNQQVHGWLHQYSAAFIADLSQLQCENGISGAVGEIGVHMGRLFILLKLTAMENERCFALDVFGEQHLNIDKSGFGNRDTFLRNVRQWTGDADITVMQSSSLGVRASDIVDIVGQCRLVSIDGGHTEDLVYNDLQLIETVLIERGVIILDDFFNEAWPGVAAGAARYFLDPLTKMRPFAISPNKIYLARQPHHGFYRKAINRKQQSYFEKTVRIFGNDVDIFGSRLSDRSFNQRRRRQMVKGKIVSSGRFARKLLKVVGW